MSCLYCKSMTGSLDFLDADSISQLRTLSHMRTVTDVERWEISEHELLYRSNGFVVVSSLKFERIQRSNLQ